MKTKTGNEEQTAKKRLTKKQQHILDRTGQHAYVYILQCADGTLYTGWTTDPERREKVHNLGKGAKYTRSRLPVKIVYVEELDTKQEAMRREWQIKQYPRNRKDKLVSGYAEGKL